MHTPTPPTLPSAQQRVRIWDLPTRLFHAALVLCVLGALASGFVGDDWLQWHMWLGLAVVALLLFRLLWGVCGGYWSRFPQWWPTPARLLRQWRGQHAGMAGHSASGSVSVWVMLLLLAGQAGTGLMASDDVVYAGPLAHLVSHATVDMATRWHHWGKWALCVWLVLHVLAVLYYQWRGAGLLGSMWHGDKYLAPSTPASADSIRTRLLALVLLAACVAASWWLGTGPGQM